MPTIQTTAYQCIKCGHVWLPQEGKPIPPRACARCKQTGWNQPERYIRNCSPTVALHLTAEMKDRLRSDQRQVIKAIPLRETSQ